MACPDALKFDTVYPPANIVNGIFHKKNINRQCQPQLLIKLLKALIHRRLTGLLTLQWLGSGGLKFCEIFGEQDATLPASSTTCIVAI